MTHHSQDYRGGRGHWTKGNSQPGSSGIPPTPPGGEASRHTLAILPRLRSRHFVEGGDTGNTGVGSSALGPRFSSSSRESCAQPPNQRLRIAPVPGGSLYAGGSPTGPMSAWDRWSFQRGAGAACALLGCCCEVDWRVTSVTRSEFSPCVCCIIVSSSSFSLFTIVSFCSSWTGAVERGRRCQ